MFLEFFYLLRKRGMGVTINEWLTLLEALQKNLHETSLTGFYYLSRMILVKNEADYDRFDQVFLECFKGIHYEDPIPEEMMEWLEKPLDGILLELQAAKAKGFFKEEDLEQLLQELSERIKEQDEEHNSGSYWVGRHGASAFGNSGWHPNGIRIGGESNHRTAMSVAGERKYRDFRKDNTLDTRQFQMAFRTLRQFSAQVASSELEFDIDGTVKDTSENAGNLKIRYKHPRRNAIKLLLLMDTGGSMEIHTQLCSMLFQAATQSNFFKELHTYYFHNCIYDAVYTHPRQAPEDAVSVDWLLNNFGADYRVIIVGDAQMNHRELYGTFYDWTKNQYSEYTGIDVLKLFKSHFPYLIWLNPDQAPTIMDFRTYTHIEIAKMLPMYELSVEGLEDGMKRLLVRK